MLCDAQRVAILDSKQVPLLDDHLFDGCRVSDQHLNVRTARTFQIRGKCSRGLYLSLNIKGLSATAKRWLHGGNSTLNLGAMPCLFVSNFPSITNH